MCSASRAAVQAVALTISQLWSDEGALVALHTSHPVLYIEHAIKRLWLTTAGSYPAFFRNSLCCKAIELLKPFEAQHVAYQPNGNHCNCHVYELHGESISHEVREGVAAISHDHHVSLVP